LPDKQTVGGEAGDRSYSTCECIGERTNHRAFGELGIDEFARATELLIENYCDAVDEVLNVLRRQSGGRASKVRHRLNSLAHAF
jgi:hypothetical protein